jgi:predicted Fe-Mo cluster-binding NifX family protein
MKKVAIPTRAGQVDDHFGHCEYYTIFTIEEGKISKEETFNAPEGCGCKSNIAPILASMGVQTMLAGNMGQGALYVLTTSGIEVYRGCSGNVSEVINDFLKGEVTDSGLGCHSHEGCNNN